MSETNTTPNPEASKTLPSVEHLPGAELTAGMGELLDTQLDTECAGELQALTGVINEISLHANLQEARTLQAAEALRRSLDYGYATGIVDARRLLEIKGSLEEASHFERAHSDSDADQALATQLDRTKQPLGQVLGEIRQRGIAYEGFDDADMRAADAAYGALGDIAAELRPAAATLEDIAEEDADVLSHQDKAARAELDTLAQAVNTMVHDPSAQSLDMLQSVHDRLHRLSVTMRERRGQIDMITTKISKVHEAIGATMPARGRLSEAT